MNIEELGSFLTKIDNNKEDFFVSENARQIFSIQDCTDHKRVGPWIEDWVNNDNLPKCGLELDYPDVDKIEWVTSRYSGYKFVTINIRDLLDRFINGGYKLNSYKYYDLRLKLAANSKDLPLHYPEVTLGSDGKYHLGEGRHRLNAILKIYGVETLKVICLE